MTEFKDLLDKHKRFTWCESYNDPMKQEDYNGIEKALTIADKMQWRPIETAPKDGKTILGFFPTKAGYYADQRFMTIHWTGFEWENTTSGTKPSYNPTHYMELPQPPKGNEL